MIQRAYITAWRSRAAWLQDPQVEKDLVLSRALVELFDEEAIAGQLALRGGTTLHKLYLTGSRRYSGDTDLVQVNSGAIDLILSAIHRRLDSWLGTPQWKQGAGRVTLYYRFNTAIEPMAPMRMNLPPV